MTLAEKIRSNIDVHGVAWAGRWCFRNRVPFDTFYFTIFGRYPA